MNRYIYNISDDEGYTLLEILSPWTLKKDDEAYFDKHIRALLPAIAASNNVEHAYWNVAGRHNGEG